MAGFFRADPLSEIDNMFRDFSRLHADMSRMLGPTGLIDTNLPALTGGEEGRAPGSKSGSTALAPFMSGTQLAQWAPRFDVRDTDNSLVVHAELPGVPKENINVDVRNGVLTVSGKNEQAHEEKNDKWYVKERRFGSFRRSVRLPEGVDRDNVKAKFENGVLEVSVPKASKDADQQKSITIE